MSITKKVSASLAGLLTFSTLGGYSTSNINPTNVLAAATQKPNILILLEDDAANHASYLGTPGISTPNIDALGHDGITFTNAFTTNATCSCARAAMLTGMYTSKNGLWVNCGEVEMGNATTARNVSPTSEAWKIRSDSAVMPQYQTFYEVAKLNGYATGMFQKFHISPIWRFPLDYVTNLENSGADLTKFINLVGNTTPWLVQINFPETHRPWKDKAGFDIDPNTVDLPDYLPDTEFFRRDYADYLMNVQYIDNKIGGIISALKASGQYDNTIIIFTSDQGYAYQMAKGTLYNEDSKVPLIIAGPNIQKDVITNELVSHVDIMPTLIDLVGANMDASKKAEMQGISIKSFLTGSSNTTGRTYAFADYEGAGSVRMVTDGKYYLVRNVDALDPNYKYPFIDDVWPPNDARRAAWKNFTMLEMDNNKETPSFSYAWEVLNRQISRQYEELYNIDEDYYTLHNILQQSTIPTEATAIYNELKAEMDRVMAGMNDVGDGAPIAARVKAANTFDSTVFIPARWQTIGVNATAYNTPVTPPVDPPVDTEAYSVLATDSFTDNAWSDTLSQTGTAAAASIDNGSLKLNQATAGAMELFYSKVPVYKVGELGRRDVNFKLKLGKNENKTIQNIFVQLGKADGSIALAGAQFQGTTMPAAIDFGKVSPISIQNTETNATTLALMKALPTGYDDGNFHDVKIVYNRTTTTAATCSLYWDGTPIYENYAFAFSNTTDMVLMLRMLPAGTGIRRPGWTQVTSWVDDLLITKGTPPAPVDTSYKILARENFADSTWINNFTKFGTNISAAIVDQSLNLTQQTIVNINHIYANTPIYKATETGRREVIFDLKLGETHNIFVQLGKSDGTAVSSVGACFLGANIASAPDYGKVTTATSSASESFSLPTGFDVGFHNVKFAINKTSETAATCSLYWDNTEIYKDKAITLPTGTDLYALIRGIPGDPSVHRYPSPTLNSYIKNFIITSGVPVAGTYPIKINQKLLYKDSISEANKKLMLEEGKMLVSLKVQNISLKDISPTAIITLYKGNKMITVKTKLISDILALSSGSIDVDLDFALPTGDSISDYKINVYVFNSEENIMPLTEKVSITSTNIY